MAALIPPRQRKEPIYRATGCHLVNLSDEELRKRYRFGQDSIDYICELVDIPLRRATQKATALTVEQQVCIALRYYASGAFLEVIGDTMGYNMGTVSRAIDDVTNALLAKKDDFIKWPTSVASKNHIKCGFYEIGRFPNCIGCIDGTHVRIQRPSEDEAAFINRKGYPSINVQAVCDHEGKFTNIVANWPGCTHDSFIFNSSNLCRHLEVNHRGLADGVILGDSGYACRPFLMTPYSNPVLQHQQNFNRSHVTTRCLIEKTVGVWKRRFHVLHSEIRMKPEKVCRIIGACAILHNIAVIRREPLVNDDAAVVNQPVDVPAFHGRQDGRSIRDHIASVFFQ